VNLSGPVQRFVGSYRISGFSAAFSFTHAIDKDILSGIRTAENIMVATASCWWLQDHLEFSWLGGIHACCYGYPKYDPESDTHIEVGHVQVATVEGNTFPHEAVRRGREQIHQLLASQHADGAVCLECPQLRTKSWRKKQYLVDKITLNTWSHCNLKCHYCFVAHPDFRPSKVAYDLHAVMSDMLSGGHLNPKGDVTWGGGDISALPAFNEVSDLFRDYGVSQIFKTSGFKYLRGVAQTIKMKRGVLEVSVDAGTPATYAKIKGRNAFARVTENLHRYRENGDVRLKFIAEKDNLNDEDIGGFVELARSLGINRVTVTPEWTQCHSKELATPYYCDRIAELLLRLKQVVPIVDPLTKSRGERFFPGCGTRSHLD
jgi:pyruvate-formate lyase-activating enzyme